MTNRSVVLVHALDAMPAGTNRPEPGRLSARFRLDARSVGRRIVEIVMQAPTVERVRTLIFGVATLLGFFSTFEAY